MQMNFSIDYKTMFRNTASRLQRGVGDVGEERVM